MDEAKSVISFKSITASSIVSDRVESSSCSDSSTEESCNSNAFGDSDCGEPLVAQHLCLDFTPSDADDDFAQKKCCDFWEYITSRRDLKHMMVLPELATSDIHESIKSLPSDTKPALPCPEKTKTAVSMLQLVEEKGLIHRAFEVKIQRSRCSLGLQEYELDPTTQKTKCLCPEPCGRCFNAQSASGLHAICEELQAWDMLHPKSMEPPGQPPALGQSAM